MESARARPGGVVVGGQRPPPGPAPQPRAPPLGVGPRPYCQSPPDLSPFNNPALVPLSFPAPLALPSFCNPVP